MDSKEYAPFDNTLTVTDDAGRPIRYLTDPLQEHYIQPPGDFIILDGMLPPEELEVAKAAAVVKFCTEQLARNGLWTRLFHRALYQEAYNLAVESQRNLRTLVNSSPAHKAAIRRIVNAMPRDNGGREALEGYIR